MYYTFRPVINKLEKKIMKIIKKRKYVYSTNVYFIEKKKKST